MYLCVFEDDRVPHLLPLVYTHPVYDLRIGMRTLLETTRDAFDGVPVLLHARAYLAAVAAQEHDLLVNRIPDGLDVLFVNGRYVAGDGPVLERLRRAAQPGEPARVFVQGDAVVAAWVPGASSRYVEGDAVTRASFDGLPEETVEGAAFIDRLWHLIDALRPALERDFRHRTRGYNIYERPGAVVKPGALLAGGEQIYLAPGARIQPGAVLNAEDGPVYVDADAVVFENAIVRGPAYVGPCSQVKPGADIEGCAIGGHSKVGGEVLETIVHSYTNKAHDGHLGHAYLGRWCNLGADTNNSNLKNDYSPVSLYNAATGAFESTGRQFMGLVMADHSKCGIDTMFNTGTVVGVFCNIYGSGFQPRHLPSFSWGGADTGFTEYRLEKAMRVAETVMARRQVPFSEAHRRMLSAVYTTTRAGRRNVYI